MDGEERGVKVRITTNAPVRYAKWPAQPSRLVGTLLKPGDSLIIEEKDQKWFRFVTADAGNVTDVHISTDICPDPCK
jgi:hypothetical protein